MSKDTKYAAFDVPIEIRTGVIGIYRLVGQMRWVLAHPDLAVEMGREARKFARVYFSTERHVQGYPASLLVGSRLASIGRCN